MREKSSNGEKNVKIVAKSCQELSKRKYFLKKYEEKLKIFQVSITPWDIVVE